MVQKLPLAFFLIIIGCILTKGFPTGDDSNYISYPEKVTVDEISSVVKRDSNGGDTMDGYEEDYEESDEEECPRKMFWHIRGKRCVPWECPYGNKHRDAMTGECIFPRMTARNILGSQQFYSPKFPYRYANSGRWNMGRVWGHTFIQRQN